MKKLATVFVLLVLTASLISAQELKEQFDANGVKNLITAINSDNPGLQRSGLYLAGKYKVIDAAESVIAAYDKSETMSSKFLALHVMLQLGDKKSIAKVKEISKFEENETLRTLAYSYYSNVVDIVLRYASN